MKLALACILGVGLVASSAAMAETQRHSTKNQQSSGKISAPGVRTFIFNPRTVSWAAYEADGTKVAGGLANGGSHYCADVKRRCHTPTGSFRLQSKGSYGCKSTRYPIKHTRYGTVRGGAHMPYCMYFSKNFAIHGYGHIGTANVSHGCIRVTTASAQWLRGFLPIGGRVIVRSY